jgi:hypothetical protein
LTDTEDELDSEATKRMFHVFFGEAEVNLANMANMNGGDKAANLVKIYEALEVMISSQELKFNNSKLELSEQLQKFQFTNSNSLRSLITAAGQRVIDSCRFDDTHNLDAR